MEVYLLQVLVGMVDESIVVENVLGVWEQQAREGLIQFIGILEVTVIQFLIEATYLPIWSWILLFYNLIVYNKILYSKINGERVKLPIFGGGKISSENTPLPTLYETLGTCIV